MIEHISPDGMLLDEKNEKDDFPKNSKQFEFAGTRYELKSDLGRARIIKMIGETDEELYQLPLGNYLLVLTNEIFWFLLSAIAEGQSKMKRREYFVKTGILGMLG